MIFITIGSQFPFDRLIRAVDDIAPKLKNQPIIAQVGKSKYSASNIKMKNFIYPSEFTSYLKKADLIIGHAGMGTILSVMELNKPLLVMPRLKKFGEVTTDHQLATVKKFKDLNYFYISYNETELKNKLLNMDSLGFESLYHINKLASCQLIKSLKIFMNA